MEAIGIRHLCCCPTAYGGGLAKQAIIPRCEPSQEILAFTKFSSHFAFHGRMIDAGCLSWFFVLDVVMV
jgi:hypothetical protein